MNLEENKQYKFGVFITTEDMAFKTEDEAKARVAELHAEGIAADYGELGPPCDKDGNLL